MFFSFGRLKPLAVNANSSRPPFTFSPFRPVRFRLVNAENMHFAVHFNMPDVSRNSSGTPLIIADAPSPKVHLPEPCHPVF
jgi:hypothetical protein